MNSKSVKEIARYRTEMLKVFKETLLFKQELSPLDRNTISEKYRTVLENINGFVFLCNYTTVQYEYISESIKEHLGYDVTGLSTEQLTHLTLEMIHEKQREQVLYTLFSPENLMSFDEVLSVTEGFGNEYFIGIYKKLLQADKRPRLKRYFHYVLGRLYQAEGKSSVAMQYYQQAIQEMSDGDPFDTMLRARAYEGIASITDGAERTHYMLELYKLYPQVVPFTNMKMAFRLNAPTQTKLQEQVVDDLRSCSIDFTDDASAPLITLSFKAQGQSLDVHYTVQAGGEITQQGVFTIEPTAREDAGKILAYRIFGIQKSSTGEEPPAEALPAEEKVEKPV